MPLPKEGVYTIDDIYNLPNEGRAELINGQTYCMVSPNTIHRRISTFLRRTIFNYINSKNGPCEIFYAPLTVFLQAEDGENNANYLGLDIPVVCDEDKPDNKDCHGVPDWTTKAVSSPNQQVDHYEKLALYQGTGVREYWVIDPAREVVMVYDLANETPPIIYRFTGSVRVDIYEDLFIDFNQSRSWYHPCCSRVALALLLSIPLPFC